MLDQLLDLFEVFGYGFVVIASLFSLWTNHYVKASFQRYSAQFSARGLTGAEAARRVLTSNGVTGVRIASTSGHLTDHFDPRDNTIYLSESVYANSSTAAIGVAAHEAGHAVQHAVGYVPIRIRSAIVPVTNFGSRLSTPLILIGLILSGIVGYYLALFGVLLFSLCVIFQLVTLPTEFNASSRALTALEETSVLGEAELVGAKKTLRAAALTYVAALAVSLTQFLRLLAIVTSGRRNRS